jgi:hypothetical protein
LGRLSFYPIPVAMNLVMVLTPTGSLPSPRWRPLAAILLTATVVTALADTFGSYPLLDPLAPPVHSPLAVPALAGPLQLTGKLSSLVIGLVSLVSAGSLVVRFRRARGLERQQLRWLALAVTTVVPLGVLVAILADPAFSAWGTGIARARGAAGDLCGHRPLPAV